MKRKVLAEININLKRKQKLVLGVNQDGRLAKYFIEQELDDSTTDSWHYDDLSLAKKRFIKLIKMAV